jgi:gamma-glutamyl-gamma-aminobutyrate hydrolase PuuD/uncharacterized protein YjbI with pentapeptide repeats
MLKEVIDTLFNQFDPTATGSRIVKLLEEKEDKIKRVFNAARPLIDMYQPASTILNNVLIARELQVLIFKTYSDFKSGNAETSSNLLNIAMLTSGIAASILYPTALELASSSYELASNFYNFGHSVKNQDFKTAAYEFMSAVNVLAGVGLLVYGAPELIVISLLSQAAKEICKSTQEYGNDRYFECAANLFYAAIRIKASAPHMQTIYRNQYGKEMTQADLNNLLYEIVKIQKEPEFTDKLIDFEGLLEKENFKNKIENLSLDNKVITNVAFKNFNFQNTSFQNTSVKASTFDNVVFSNCDLTKTRLIHSTFNKSHFMGCHLKRAELNWSEFNRTTFTSSDLTGVVFNDADLRNVYFTFCDLFESTFFDTKIADSKIISSNLKDCLLFEAKEKFHIIGGTLHEITRPVIGLLFNFEAPKTMAKAMDESMRDKGIVFRVHYEPKEVDLIKLDFEVKENLKEHATYPWRMNESAAQYMLRAVSEDSEIGKIKKIVAKAGKHFDGLIIPGGLDIQPELYGREKESKTVTDDNYLRSIFEFAMIDFANKINLPTLGICRGAQMVNVFFGGVLKQHVTGHDEEFQLLRMNPHNYFKKTSKVVYDILKGRYIIGYSSHHQAVEKTGKGIDSVISHDNVPKVMISKMKKGAAYATFLLTQIHPEMHKMDEYKSADIFQNNVNFFTNLVDRAKLYRSAIAA